MKPGNSKRPGPKPDARRDPFLHRAHHIREPGSKVPLIKSVSTRIALAMKSKAILSETLVTEMHEAIEKLSGQALSEKLLFSAVLGWVTEDPLAVHSIETVNEFLQSAGRDPLSTNELVTYMCYRVEEIKAKRGER